MADLSPLYEALTPNPDADYGTLLPFAKNRVGSAEWVMNGPDTRFAMPSMVRETLKGYLDLARGTETGSLTPEALQALTFGSMGAGAMMAPAGALASGAARFSSRSTADRLEKLLQRHGVEIERNRFGLSDSQYLTAQIYNKATDEYSNPLKIRLSSHEAKPTYERLNGAADYEIGQHSMSHTSDPVDAAGMILQRLGIAPDRRLAPILQRQAAEREAEMAQKKALEDAQRQRHLDLWAETQKIDAILEAQGYVRNDMGGKKWRELRSKHRREQGLF